LPDDTHPTQLAMHTGWARRAALAALARPKRGAGVRVDWPIQLAVCAMGTRFELIIADAEPSMGTTDALAAGEAAMDIVREWHRRLSIFDAGSTVARLNAEAHLRPVALDREVFELLLVCRELHKQTNGAFDPSVGALMQAHGLRSRLSDTETAQQTVRPIAWGFDAIEFDKSRMSVRFTRPGIALDFGAIAKGLALDQAGAILREFGITSALIHGGTSSVVAIGAPPALEGWRVRLGPMPDAPVVVLRDLAMSVSAPRTANNAQPVPVEHVIDPGTGQPAGLDRQAACVGKSAILADAWSTALLVTGERPDAMPEHLCSVLVDPAHGWRVAGHGWHLQDNTIIHDPPAHAAAISTRKTHPA